MSLVKFEMISLLFATILIELVVFGLVFDRLISVKKAEFAAVGVASIDELAPGVRAR